MHQIVASVGGAAQKLTEVEMFLNRRGVRADQEEWTNSGGTYQARHVAANGPLRFSWRMLIGDPSNGGSADCLVRLLFVGISYNTSVAVFYDAEAKQWRTAHENLEKSQEASAIAARFPQGFIPEHIAYEIIGACAKVFVRWRPAHAAAPHP